MKRFLFSSIFAVIATLPANQAMANSSLQPIEPQQKLIDSLVNEHQFERQFIEQTFANAKPNQRIITLMSKPAEGKPWHQYRNIFLKSKRIEQGKVFLQEHQAILHEAEEKYGVPPEVITAIIGVETYYGRQKGSFNVFDALYTLGYYYPESKPNRERRSKFFRKELVNFLNLARQQNWDITKVQGSYAGAMGYGQFMPSSYLSYARDYELDGRIDLFENPKDAIVSVANYFKAHGWQAGKAVAQPFESQKASELAQSSLKLKHPVLDFAQHTKLPEAISATTKAGVFAFDKDADQQEYLLAFDNFYTITRYNHSRLYARAVWELAEAIKSK